MFQLAYFQMVGAGKARNQDALFDGTAVRVRSGCTKPACPR